MFEQAFWNSFFLKGYLSRPKNREEGLGPALKLYVSDFVDSPQDVLVSLRCE